MADRFARACAAIDAANAQDPHHLLVDGVERPKELVHAEVAVRWLQRVDPDCGELALLAARAHHLRRWVVPRSDYPDGRAGYLRWRADHKRRQAAEVAELVEAAGYEPQEASRVAAIVAKEHLRTDPQVQAHEDALCLTFLELQLDEVTSQLGHDRTVEVVAKTLGKMSEQAIELAQAIPLSDAGAAVVAEAARSVTYAAPVRRRGGV